MSLFITRPSVRQAIFILFFLGVMRHLIVRLFCLTNKTGLIKSNSNQLMFVWIQLLNCFEFMLQLFIFKALCCLGLVVLYIAKKRKSIPVGFSFGSPPTVVWLPSEADLSTSRLLLLHWMTLWEFKWYVVKGYTQSPQNFSLQKKK